MPKAPAAAPQPCKCTHAGAAVRASMCCSCSCTCSCSCGCCCGCSRRQPSALLSCLLPPECAVRGPDGGGQPGRRDGRPSGIPGAGPRPGLRPAACPSRQQARRGRGRQAGGRAGGRAGGWHLAIALAAGAQQLQWHRAEALLCPDQPATGERPRSRRAGPCGGRSMQGWWRRRGSSHSGAPLGAGRSGQAAVALRCCGQTLGGSPPWPAVCLTPQRWPPLHPAAWRRCWSGTTLWAAEPGWARGRTRGGATFGPVRAAESATSSSHSAGASQVTAAPASDFARTSCCMCKQVCKPVPARKKRRNPWCAGLPRCRRRPPQAPRRCRSQGQGCERRGEAAYRYSSPLARGSWPRTLGSSTSSSGTCVGCGVKAGAEGGGGRDGRRSSNGLHRHAPLRARARLPAKLTPQQPAAWPSHDTPSPRVQYAPAARAPRRQVPSCWQPSHPPSARPPSGFASPARTSSPRPSAYARSSSLATWRCVMRAPLIFCAALDRS